MSHNCNLGLAPYVAQNVLDCECSDLTYDKYVMLCDPANYREEEPESDNLVSSGWKHVPYDHKKPSLSKICDGAKNKSILSEKWEKDGFVVWLVNESQYSNVSAYSMSVVSDNKKSIQLFLKDHGFVGKITKNTPIQSWW